MKHYETQGEIKLFYFDGSGFSTTSCIPYAWQEIGKTYEIPRQRSKRLNVLGFMSRDNKSYFHTIEGSVTSGGVILDNASIHHSKAVKLRMSDWMRQGVFLHFLPTYSPELNLIEILWRKIKYEWLSMSAYKNYPSLKESVLEILHGFGIKNKITFA